MSYRHRDEEGLPDGYRSRGGRLALEVKVYRSATEEECRSVGEELGVREGEVSGPLENERGGARGVFGGPWGREWLELLATHRPEEYATLEGFARESAHEYAEDYARELLGRGVELYQDGRSGGWLVIHGRAGDADAAREAVELAARDAGEAEPDDEERILEARELLAALERFREHVAAAVADFPRAVAWQVCANGFQPAAEAYRRTCELERAREALAESVAAMRTGIGHAADIAGAHGRERAALDLEALAARYDAARAEVDRLENEGGAE